MKRRSIRHFTRQFIIFCLFGLLIAGASVAFAQTPTPGANSTTTGLVTLTVSTDRQQAFLNEAITVQVRLTGDSNQCPRAEIDRSVDVVLVIDRSGSMSDDIRKIEQAKQAAVAFLGEMKPSDRVGLVVFTENADVLSLVSQDFKQVEDAIGTINANGGTNIAAGLQKAYDVLKPVRRSDAIPVVIVLSDGRSDVPAMEQVANTLKSDGFVVVSVGLGSDVDQNAMQRIASIGANGKPLYYFAPDSTQLSEIYRTIARAIRQYRLVTDLQIQILVDSDAYQILPDSLQPQSGTVTANTIVWQQDTLTNNNTTFSFQVRARKSGELAVIKSIRASFRECEQQAKELSLDSIPVVTIIEPVSNSTPLPSIEPVSNSTPLPSIEPVSNSTPLPSIEPVSNSTPLPSIEPVSNPTPLPSIEPVSDPPPMPPLCTPWQQFPWWLLWPLLVLSLLAPVSFTPAGRHFWRQWWAKGVLCKVPAILWLATLLISSTLLAQALIGDTCRAPLIYVWKIVAGGEVGVYRAHITSQQVEPVLALNQGSNCVACHQVSSRHQIAAVRDEQNGKVIVIRPDGSRLSLPADVRASYVVWSPDGEQMALSYNDTDIYILDLRSGILKPLPGASEPDVVETMPAWSPDGATIAFVRASQTALPPKTAELQEPCDIYTVPSTGGQATPLLGASGSGFNYYPAYSPNGRWLAFTRHIDGTSTYADRASDIYLIPATGASTPVRLSVNSDDADSWPGWSPDSRWLSFASKRRGQFDVFAVPIDDNGLPEEIVYDEHGNRSAIFRVPVVAQEQDAEIHPVWVVNEVPLWQRVVPLWPWLIPVLFLPLLLWFWCREPEYLVEVEVVDGLSGDTIPSAEVSWYRQEREE